MPKQRTDLDLEDDPRSFRCEKALGRVIDSYAKLWERTPSYVIKLCLRLRFANELPQELQPKEYKLKEDQ